MVYRHRLTYCVANGVTLATIEGKVVRHTCDNPRCINPVHLQLGTQADNVRDRQERGRNVKGVASFQAKLTEADVLYIRANYVRHCELFNMVALGRKFNVNKSTISNILKRKVWTHI